MSRNETFAALSGGWVGYRDHSSAAWNLVRFRLGDGNRFEAAVALAAADEREINSNDLRALPLSRIVAFANGVGRERLVRRIEDPFEMDDYLGIDPDVEEETPQRRVRLKLTVPKGRRSDDFYRKVAELYLHLAQQSGRPAADIAAANDIENVTTVHGWVREARRRGFLPPGRAGKVG